MARISELPMLAAPAGTETVVVLDGATTRRATLRPLVDAAAQPAIGRAALLADAAAASSAIALAQAQIGTDRALQGAAYLEAIRQLTGGSPTSAQLTLQATTRAILAAFAAPTLGRQAVLSEPLCEGIFSWVTGDWSAEVAADPRQALFVASAADPVGATGAWKRMAVTSYRPEWWRAAGDGKANDTDAFAALGRAVSRRGGGAIDLRPGATYLVGKQTTGTSAVSGYTWRYSDILKIVGCTRGLVIRGNGARMLAADGLRYGTFNAAGDRVDHPMPYTTGSPEFARDLAAPYIGMVELLDCTGGIRVENLELDGNIANAVIGGQYGDTGWQLAYTGLYSQGHRCAIEISGLDSHNHGLDGIVLSRLPAASGDHALPGTSERAGLLSNSRFHRNGRNNISIVGGAGWKLERIVSAYAGRNGRVATAPMSGLDLEAEDSPVRDVLIETSDFLYNNNTGLVSDSTRVSDVTVSRCRLFGSADGDGAGQAFYLGRPRFRFVDCKIGAVWIITGGLSPATWPEFDNCIFTDDRLTFGTTPEGGAVPEVFRGGFADTYGTGATFRRCTFDFNVNGQVPRTYGGSRYIACRLSQAVGPASFPVGIYSDGSVVAGGPTGFIGLGFSTYLDDTVYGDRVLGRSGEMKLGKYGILFDPSANPLNVDEQDRRFGMFSAPDAWAVQFVGGVPQGSICLATGRGVGEPVGWVSIAPTGSVMEDWAPIGIVGAVPASARQDSEATTIAALRADFNALLAGLRSSNLMQR